MHTHELNEGFLSEFAKIYKSGIDCVLLIQNDKNIIEDNGEILQEKEFEVLGQKFRFKYCVYTVQTLKDMKLPLFALYDQNASYGKTIWFNLDYTHYIIRKFLPNYEFYFYIENDCFLNGDYKDFFALYENDDTDLFLTRFRQENEHTRWWPAVDTQWFCEPNNLYGCFFPINRISAKALDKLYPRRVELAEIYSKLDLSKTKAQWLICEIFFATEGVKMGLSVKSTLNCEKVQWSEFGIDLSTQRIFVNPDNKMYHAVKGNFLQRLADKDKAFEAERVNFRAEILALKNELNALPHKISEQELTNLKLDESVKKLEVKKLEKELGMKLSKLEPRVSLILSENLRNSAVARVRNHLAYRLGAAIIVCNKSFFGLLGLPFVLKFIKAQYKKEQNAYQVLIKQKPEFKLPKIDTYPDYKAALKEKECLTYKLGEAMMKADKAWYKFGYVKFYFEAKRLEREFKAKI